MDELQAVERRLARALRSRVGNSIGAARLLVATVVPQLGTPIAARYLHRVSRGVKRFGAGLPAAWDGWLCAYEIGLLDEQPRMAARTLVPTDDRRLGRIMGELWMTMPAREAVATWGWPHVQAPIEASLGPRTQVFRGLATDFEGTAGELVAGVALL